MKCLYVFPNLSKFNKNGRGNIKQRFNELVSLSSSIQEDFKIVEMPGDFIKNATEITRSDLPLGTFLSTTNVSTIYDPPNGFIYPYTLHTEPELPRHTSNSKITPKLRWYDNQWIKGFIGHIVAICEYLGEIPEYIEVHPGSVQQKKNTIQEIIEGIVYLSDHFKEHFGKYPNIILENRTSHVISSGFEVKKFWHHVEKLGLTSKQQSIKIVVDIQQLFTDAKNRKFSLNKNLNLIPPDSIAGFHIHQLHRTPLLTGSIDWNIVKTYIHTHLKSSSFFILPEVHHLKQLIDTYQFCKRFLAL